jgi:hypothetical protein
VMQGIRSPRERNVVSDLLLSLPHCREVSIQLPTPQIEGRDSPKDHRRTDRHVLF